MQSLGLLVGAEPHGNKIGAKDMAWRTQTKNAATFGIGLFDI